jgi:DNA mismatch endonuclease (patch repair protein)
MALIRDRNSRFEMVVCQLLRQRGYRFKRNVAHLPGKPDLVFVRERKIVFLHGCFWHWHGCHKCRMPASNVSYWRQKLDGNRARDARSEHALRAAGWSVMTIWECQYWHSEKLASRVARFLSRPKRRARN